VSKYLSNIDRSLQVKIDSQALYDDDKKIGLGSSASVTVALLEGIDRYLGKKKSIREKISSAIDIHNNIQNANGSGGDITVSYLGGWIEYTKEDLGRALPQVKANSFHYLLISTLEPMNTASSIHEFNRWKKGAGSTASQLIVDMNEVTQQGILATKLSDWDLLSQSIHDFSSCLKRLQSQSGIQIYSTRHNKISAIANRYGLSYKPCGAGGDLGFLFSKEPIDREICQEIMPYGKVLELELMALGAIDQ